MSSVFTLVITEARLKDSHLVNRGLASQSRVAKQQQNVHVASDRIPTASYDKGNQALDRTDGSSGSAFEHAAPPACDDDDMGVCVADDATQAEWQAMAALGLPVCFSGGGVAAQPPKASQRRRHRTTSAGRRARHGGARDDADAGLEVSTHGTAPVDDMAVQQDGVAATHASLEELRPPVHDANDLSVILGGRTVQPCGTHIRFETRESDKEQGGPCPLTPPPRPAAADAPEAKYWNQRYRFFSRFDQGCRLAGDMWFSVTPEVVARHQARQMGRLRKQRQRQQHHGATGGGGGADDTSAVVIDAFAGCGGNAIAFAVEGAYVLACDLCASHLAMAKHNATVYGVAQYIDFVAADWTCLSAAMVRHRRCGLAQAVFLSPPWGGPTYAEADTFDLLHAPLAGGHTARQLVAQAMQLAPQVAAFLPRTVCVDHVDSLAREAGATTAVLEENYLNDKLKAMTLYCSASVA